MKPKQALTAVAGVALIILFILLALKLTPKLPAPRNAAPALVPYAITQSAPKAGGG